MRAVLASLFILAFARCATIDHGPMQRIRVDSDPVATVRTKDCGPASTKRTTTAPDSVVWVSRRATHCTLTFTAPGFEPQTVQLQRRIHDKTFNNARHVGDFCYGDALDCRNASDLTAALFLGGLFAGTGFGIDAMTGAMYQQEPREVWVELVPEP